MSIYNGIANMMQCHRFYFMIYFIKQKLQPYIDVHWQPYIDIGLVGKYIFISSMMPIGFWIVSIYSFVINVMNENIETSQILCFVCANQFICNYLVLFCEFDIWICLSLVVFLLSFGQEQQFHRLDQMKCHPHFSKHLVVVCRW